MACTFKKAAFKSLLFSKSTKEIQGEQFRRKVKQFRNCERIWISKVERNGFFGAASERYARGQLSVSFSTGGRVYRYNWRSSTRSRTSDCIAIEGPQKRDDFTDTVLVAKWYSFTSFDYALLCYIKLKWNGLLFTRGTYALLLDSASFKLRSRWKTSTRIEQVQPSWDLSDPAKNAEGSPLCNL